MLSISKSTWHVALARKTSTNTSISYTFRSGKTW